MYWMNLIRKSGRTELVLNIRDLPQDMQDALIQAGLGAEDGALMGAFHSESKNVYIFLPEFARSIKAENPKVDLSSSRAERLIINKLLAVIEHENLHKVMDDDITEFAVEKSQEFIDEIVLPNTLEFILNIDDVRNAMLANATVEGLRPLVEDMLKDTGKHLIHEIMVRMVMQYDNNKIIQDLSPYIRQFAGLMLNTFGQAHAPLRMLTADVPELQNMIDGLMGVLMNSVPNYWGNLMRELFIRNNEQIIDFIQWNIDAVMTESMFGDEHS